MGDAFQRWGADVTLTADGRQLRLLSVHPRSGCWGERQDRDAKRRKTCVTLRGQVERLKAWADARRVEGVPFIILGDFNRRLTLPGDWGWRLLSPPSAPLRLLTEGVAFRCEPRFPAFIDHMVAGGGVEAMLAPGSFREAARRGPHSDHCAISAVFRLENRTAGRLRRRHEENRLLADRAVAIAVAHEAVGGMAARHRRDAVPPRLGAGNPAVPVVVIKPERIDGIAGRRLSRFWSRGHRGRGAGRKHQVGRGAAGEHARQCGGLPAVDREAVFALDRDDAPGEPASVHRRKPVGGVVGRFAGAAAAVYRGRGEGQVERVGGEAPAGRPVGGAETAVMRLGDGDDMFDVGLSGAREIPPGIGPVDPPAHRHDDAGLHRLGIGVVAAS